MTSEQRNEKVERLTELYANTPGPLATPERMIAKALDLGIVTEATSVGEFAALLREAIAEQVEAVRGQESV